REQKFIADQAAGPAPRSIARGSFSSPIPNRLNGRECARARSATPAKRKCFRCRIQFQPGFRSCDRQKARGGILAQQRRWVSASDQTSISGACRKCQTHDNNLRGCKNDFALHSRTPSLLQDSASLSNSV